MTETSIPNTHAITHYLHCKQCLAEVRTGDHATSLQDYARLEVGYTPRGLQIWCVRHDANVIHLDFEGQGPFPANTTRAGDGVQAASDAAAGDGEGPLMIDCDVHGRAVSAVVCGHLLDASGAGFVENSAAPGDLQAWCDACEARFQQEGELNEAFRAFNRMSLVCEACYAAIKSRAGG